MNKAHQTLILNKKILATFVKVKKNELSLKDYLTKPNLTQTHLI